MLSEFISKLERDFPFFNQKSLTRKDLTSWASSLGIYTVKDRDVKTALSFITLKGNKVILYNPEIHPDNLILSLGHELGHWLLGHVEYGEVLFNPSAYFSTSGLEKDAGVIGFLCWFPTWRLEEIYQQRGYLELQELAWEYHNCDSEWDLLLKLFHARCRIFRAWKRSLSQPVSRENPK